MEDDLSHFMRIQKHRILLYSIRKGWHQEDHVVHTTKIKYIVTPHM